MKKALNVIKGLFLFFVMFCCIVIMWLLNVDLSEGERNCYED